MQILVTTLIPDPFNGSYPGPPGPGQRFIFTKNLVLQRYDNNTPGNGLPPNAQNRLAGSYSGVVTTLRNATANDPFYAPGSYLIQSSTRPYSSSIPWPIRLCSSWVRSPPEGWSTWQATSTR
jgi:hypothetical protein